VAADDSTFKGCFTDTYLAACLQARAENVALNEQQFQQRVQHRVEQLRVNHDCRHRWSRRQPALAEYCEHCRNFPLFVYCYYCSGCQMVVCNVCRFHRVR
jgi:hypothetical protein